MAGVNGISFGAVSIKELALAKSSPSVSTGSAKSFEQFLSKGAAAQNKGAQAGSAKDVSSKSGALEQPGSSFKRDGLSAGQADSLTQAGAGSGTVDAAKAAELEQEIRGIVKDALGTDDETLDAALEMMGITVMDLFDTAILQQFVLLVNGGKEATDFLTDEGLMQSFMELAGALEDFAAENANSLAAMMEVLDTPVVFDEFLEQQGISAEEVSELAGTGEDTDGLPVMQGALKDSTDTRKSEMQDLAENVTVTQEEGQAEGSVAGTQDTSQDSSLEENTSGDASKFSGFQRDVEEPQPDVTPLFADQLNGMQDDMADVWKAQMNGTQRMQQMIDIVNQVSTQIRNSISEDVTTMEMQLNPERLGKVLFSVVSKAGVMTATFQVQSEEAKYALESQMYSLRETLEAKNLKVESVDVQISDFNFTQSNEAEAQNQRQNEAAKQGRRKFRFETEETDSVEGTAEGSAEAVRRQVMRDTGGSIDFTA